MYIYTYRKERETKMLTSASRSKEHIKEIGNQIQKKGKGKKKRKKTQKKLKKGGKKAPMLNSGGRMITVCKNKKIKKYK